jgi:hypothetical protein
VPVHIRQRCGDRRDDTGIDATTRRERPHLASRQTSSSGDLSAPDCPGRAPQCFELRCAVGEGDAVRVGVLVGSPQGVACATYDLDEPGVREHGHRLA